MARTRTASHVPLRGSASQSQPPAGDSYVSDKYSWIEESVREANSVVFEDDTTAYMESLPEAPCFELNRPAMGDRMRVLNSLHICPSQFYPNGWAFARTYELICNYCKAARVANAEECGQPAVVVAKLQDKELKAVEQAGGSSTPFVPSGANSVHPSVWDDHFVLSRGPIRAVVNNPLYTSKDVTFLGDQIPVDVARQVTNRALEIASSARHMEENFLPLFEKTETDQLIALEENKALQERNKKLEEDSTKLVEEMKTVWEALANEKFFKGLANNEKNALQATHDDVKLRAKADLDMAKTNLDKVLKEFEEIKARLLKSEFEYLKILNWNLMVFGLDPCVYVIDGVIMEDSLQGPIPFVPRKQVIGDFDQTSVQDLGKKVEGLRVEEPIPLSTRQQSSKEDPEVASKDATIHLD
ncbi:anucleate primary sterigmata protein A [Sesbania bispinosa]|nr:anucleate primary sterigmata protein A [Sesbania bispinosa]